MLDTRMAISGQSAALQATLYAVTLVAGYLTSGPLGGIGLGRHAKTLEAANAAHRGMVPSIVGL